MKRYEYGRGDRPTDQGVNKGMYKLIIQVVVKEVSTQIGMCKANYTQSIHALFKILKIFSLRGSGSSNLGLSD